MVAVPSWQNERNKNKGNPKRKLALEYIVKLINDLPSHQM
jgi:hypothetical protein